MIISILIGLATWALVATYFLTRTIRNSDKRAYFHRLARKEASKLPEEKKFDAFLSIHETEEKFIPWFQRSISTLGVVAFFSMSAAALTQTISAQLSEFKASAAERRYSYIQETAKTTEVANARSSSAMLAMIASGVPRMPEMTAFLESRLELLTDPKRPVDSTPQDVQESIAIAIGLKNIHCAAQVWRNHPEIRLDSLKLQPSDALAFSTLFYFIGDDALAHSTLDQVHTTNFIAFEENVSAIRYLISGQDSATMERLKFDISSRFRQPPADVESRIRMRAREFTDQRSRLSLTRRVDFCRSDPSA